MWTTATTDEFDAWFTELDEDGQVEIMAKVELLILLGPRLGRPHADTLNGSRHSNMKELRADTRDQVLRIAFAFDPDVSDPVDWWRQVMRQPERFYNDSSPKPIEFTTHIWKELPYGGRARVCNMAKIFDELVRRTTTKKAQQRAAVRAQELLGELLLSEIRKLAGKSQREVAEELGIKQPSLSKLEKQSDMQISTLRRIVAHLGGELEVVAKFPNGSVRIKQFNEPVHSSGAERPVSRTRKDRG